MWKIVKALFGIILLSLIIISVVLTMKEAKELEALRQSDPVTYLKALEGEGDLKWMLALKEIDQQRYVDAQNGFGAMLRSHYSVHLKHTETGWSVYAFQIQ